MASAVSELVGVGYNYFISVISKNIFINKLPQIHWEN